MRKFAYTALAAAALAAPSFAGQVAEMLPGQLNAAGFINVSAIMREYGMLFDGGPIAEQLDQLVQMGLPDPRTDLDQVAIGGTIEDSSDRTFVMVTTGGLRVEPIVQLVAMQRGAEVDEVAYRGTTMYGIREPGAQQAEAILSNLDEDAAMGSFDEKGLHPFGKLLVETARGSNTSFAQKYGTQMGESDYALISAEIPKDLRRELEDMGQLAFLSLITHVRASLRQVGDNVRLEMDGVCMDDFDAEALKRALVKVKDRLKDELPDPELGLILETMTITREDATAKLGFELPEEFLRDLLGAIAGRRFAD